MRRSRRTTSKEPVESVSGASRPVAAVSTRYPSASSPVFRTIRFSGSSSTARMAPPRASALTSHLLPDLLERRGRERGLVLDRREEVAGLAELPLLRGLLEEAARLREGDRAERRRGGLEGVRRAAQDD